MKLTAKKGKRKTKNKRTTTTKIYRQKDREDEKAEGYVPDEGTRKNPRKTTILKLEHFLRNSRQTFVHRLKIRFK